jgi:hypothetical protein
MGPTVRQFAGGKRLRGSVPCTLGEGGVEGSISALVHLHTTSVICAMRPDSSQSPHSRRWIDTAGGGRRSDG